MISVKDGSGNSVDINHDAGFNHAYTYRGYRYDQESGLYFLQSRYYQAGTGSFLTKDTVKGDPQDSQSLNRYAYTSGDPVNYSDPDGHGMVMNDDGTGPVVYTASSSGASKASSSSSSGSVAKAVSRPPVSSNKWVQGAQMASDIAIDVGIGLAVAGVVVAGIGLAPGILTIIGGVSIGVGVIGAIAEGILWAAGKSNGLKFSYAVLSVVLTPFNLGKAGLMASKSGRAFWADFKSSDDFQLYDRVMEFTDNAYGIGSGIADYFSGRKN